MRYISSITTNTNTTVTSCTFISMFSEIRKCMKALARKMKSKMKYDKSKYDKEIANYMCN